METVLAGELRVMHGDEDAYLSDQVFRLYSNNGMHQIRVETRGQNSKKDELLILSFDRDQFMQAIGQALANSED